MKKLEENFSPVNSSIIGFQYKFFTQGFFPYKNQFSNFFEKKHNFYDITLSSSSKDGLPYGVLPRILLIWIITEAVKTKQKLIYLPKNISSFINQIGISRSGGKRGGITRLKQQFSRLIHTAVSIQLKGENQYYVSNIFLIEQAHLWWDDNSIDPVSYIELSEKFFNEIQKNCVPLNLLIVKEISDSCLALDMYIWMVYRYSYINEKIFISWISLKKQFGSQYNDDKKGLYNFKVEFIKQLNKIIKLYNDAKIFETIDKKGIMLYPSSTSIPKANKLNLNYVSAEIHELDGSKTLIEQVSKKYEITLDILNKVCNGKTIEQINSAIDSVEEIILSKKAKNIKSLIRKSIAEEWKPNQIKKTIKKDCIKSDNNDEINTKLYDQYINEQQSKVIDKYESSNEDIKNQVNEIFLEKYGSDSMIKMFDYPYKVAIFKEHFCNNVIMNKEEFIKKLEKV